MTHRDSNKATKPGQVKQSKPEHIHEDEMAKHTTKGLIKGTEGRE